MRSKYILLLVFFITQYFFSQGIQKSLYAYDFRMDNVLNKMTIPERANMFVAQGFKGVSFAIRDESYLEVLEKYLDTKAVKTGALQIPVVYCVMDYSKKLPPWKAVLKTAKGIDLWVIFRNTTSKKQVSETLEKMSLEAEKEGVDVVIYPHNDTSIESIEEALPYIKALNRPNLFLSLHLCHELKAGNGERLLDVAIKAKPHLKYVSISGANKTVSGSYKPNKYKSNVIQPLYEGDFPVDKFVKILQKINYQGPSFLHTWGIKESFLSHAPKSIKTWEDMVENTAKGLQTDLNDILDAPENAYWDSISKTWFISNLGGGKVTIEADGYGWITRLNEKREVISNRWVKGLDAPTGMASYKNHLFVGDRGVLVKIDIEKGQIIEKIKLPDSEFINDVAADSKGNIYVSDTFKDRIYKLSNKGKLDILIEDSQLEYPNGLWVDGDELVVATWGPMSNRATFETSRKGTLKRVNLKTKQISSIGFSKPIANFDGVVKYKGYYYATDWTGGRLLQISEQGDVKEVITGFQQFADLGIDTESGTLLIPEMSKNRFIMVNLKSLSKD